MVRKFISYDGEVLAEEEWEMNPNTRCFYCDKYLIGTNHTPCNVGFLGQHDYVTLVNPVT